MAQRFRAPLDLTGREDRQRAIVRGVLIGIGTALLFVLALSVAAIVTAR